MLSPTDIIKQINTILRELIQCSLAVDNNFPSSRMTTDNIQSIDFGKQDISIALKKDKSYNEIYDMLHESKSYTCKLIDGALVQLMYEFKDNILLRHRLAFFSSPYLSSFQNEPELYRDEAIYSDVLFKSIVAFPIRFDYDSRQERCNDCSHPASHLTLGQYENCRIPVSSPVTPHQFFDFILRNFYNTAFNMYCSLLHFDDLSFNNTISNDEQRITHLIIACTST